jgi:hypothetical protein
MRDAKKLIFVTLAFALACGITAMVIIKRQPQKETAAPTVKKAPQPAPALIVDEALPPAPPKEAPLAIAEVPVPAPPARPAARSAPLAREPLQVPLPLAREALAFVGMDPGAEEYWYAAINDPHLPAAERQNLIEDLNEDGISDPKHPGPADLPIILNRLQLIEAAGPYAMDQVNLDAFQEAYKDLVNLANLAIGGGEPVR